MSKPKAQTIQQRFGFLDDDLSKPKHDYIMQWLNNNIDSKLSNWLGISESWTEVEIENQRKMISLEIENEKKALDKQLHDKKDDFEHSKEMKRGSQNSDSIQKMIDDNIQNQEIQINRLREKYDFQSREIQKSIIPSKPNLNIISKSWEIPIKNAGYIVGFVDMVVKFERPYLTLSIEQVNGGLCEKWSLYYQKYSVSFEVKTEIPSIGETIRQINMYRSYGVKSLFIVSPDVTYTNLLKDQGIGFIQFPNNVA